MMDARAAKARCWGLFALLQGCHAMLAQPGMQHAEGYNAQEGRAPPPQLNFSSA